MVVSSTKELPLATEDRVEKFTELVATAISNAESRESLARLADVQAALRRVATLVAQGALGRPSAGGPLGDPSVGAGLVRA